MSVGNRIQAMVKNLEGRLEEAVGALTGNQRLKAEGQMKQAQANAEHTKENLKDRAKRWIDRT
ncbi:MAG: CsbD family protein [Coleofasciculus sp. S288]|nr:CsbD family protein [Coleofasciculus sp. S288]